MITIEKPFKEIIGDMVSLKARIHDEAQNIEDWLCYTTPIEYGEYLCDEICDAFVVAMLLPAVKTGQKIKVNAPISERLYHNIEHSVSTILQHVYVCDKRMAKAAIIKDPVIEINGRGDQLVTINYKGKAVATGCSLGVDSLSSYITYTSKSCPLSYRLTHLTYFNAGAMGFHDAEKAKMAYDKDLKMVQDFSKEVGLPLVCVESNVSKWYNKLFSFGQCAVMINMSVVLSMQKLFGKYYFASTFPLWEFRYDSVVMEYYETLLLPLLSTESTELIVANPEMTRVAKEQNILEYPLTQKYLYVCWKEIRANENPDSIYAEIKDNYRNCTRCDKCLRTLLAIDVMGHLEEYKSIFDIEYYKKVKDTYIAKVIAGRDINPFYGELYSLLREHNYKISKKAKLLVLPIRLSSKLSRLGQIGILKRIYYRILWKHN